MPPRATPAQASGRTPEGWPGAGASGRQPRLRLPSLAALPAGRGAGGDGGRGPRGSGAGARRAAAGPGTGPGRPSPRHPGQPAAAGPLAGSGTLHVRRAGRAGHPSARTSPVAPRRDERAPSPYGRAAHRIRYGSVPLATRGHVYTDRTRRVRRGKRPHGHAVLSGVDRPGTGAPARPARPRSYPLVPARTGSCRLVRPYPARNPAPVGTYRRTGSSPAPRRRRQASRTAGRLVLHPLGDQEAHVAGQRPGVPQGEPRLVQQVPVLRPRPLSAAGRQHHVDVQLQRHRG